MTVSIDVIDALAGLSADSALRAARPSARLYAQKSYEALFVSPGDGMMPLHERLAVALFVAELHRDAPSSDHYRALFLQSEAAELAAAVSLAAADGRAEGPYGAFSPGPLSVEDAQGPTFRADRTALGPRLAAALEHAHLLVFHPRDADPAAVEKLGAAGWSATEIVTLSQIVSFLAFQIRAGAGLRVLAAVSEVGR